MNGLPGMLTEKAIEINPEYAKAYRNLALAYFDKKKENDWVKEFRLDSYDKFLNCDMPKFGPNIDLDFEKIIYYKSIYYPSDQKY